MVTTAVRQAAVAYTTGAVIALGLDAVLQGAASAIRVTGGLTSPWWVRTIDHGAWVGIGFVLWLASPAIAQWMDDAVGSTRVSRQTLWDVIGLGFLVLPVAYLLGQWIALAARFTLLGTWTTEGRLFLSAAYYGAVLAALAPRMGAGVILRAWARHAIAD